MLSNICSIGKIDSTLPQDSHPIEEDFVSVAKVIEITATSPGSFEDAIRKGLAKAQKTVDHVKGAWISEQKVELADDGTIKHFRVDMKLTFVLEE